MYMAPFRKWGEIDLKPCCWLQLVLPGWCLVSLLFLLGVSFTDPVEVLVDGLCIGLMGFWEEISKHAGIFLARLCREG